MEQDKTFRGTEPIGKLLMKLAVPTVIAQLVNMLYNIIDRVYIGHIPGEGSMALTGVGVCMPLILIIAAFAALVGSGGSPRASIYMGKGEHDTAEKILTGCLSLQIIVSIILTVILLIWNENLLLMFGASENTISYATAYMNIYAIGTIFVQITLGMNTSITAQGKAITGMMTVLIGAVANIILDPMIIFGIGPFPAMGIAGAAIATGLGQTLSAAMYLTVYLTQPSSIRFSLKDMKPDSFLIKKLYSIGIPASLNMALPSMLISVLNILLSAYSQTYVFVLGVYYKLQTFLYLPANGIVQGMRPLIGYNYGAKQHARVKKLYELTLIMSAAIMAAGTVICLFASRPLMQLFTSNPETVAIGQTALRIICLGFVVSAVSTTSSGALEGLGKGAESLVISLCRYIVFIMPLAAVLCHFLGANGVWHAFWITEVLSAIVAYPVYRKAVGKC